MVNRKCGDFKWVSRPSNAYTSRTAPHNCYSMVCGAYALFGFVFNLWRRKCVEIYMLTFFGNMIHLPPTPLVWSKHSPLIAISSIHLMEMPNNPSIVLIKCDNKFINFGFFFLSQVTCGRCQCKKHVRSNHSHQINSILSVSNCYLPHSV